MDGYDKIVINRFDGGMNNAVSPFEIGDNQWFRAQNMMLSGVGGRDVLVRPGFIKQNRKVVSGSNGFCGLFRFYLSSGTAYWVGCIADEIRYYDDSDSYDLLTCDLTLNSNQRFRFKIYNDLILMVNGSNHPMYWDGDSSHAVHRLGIPGPSTAISAYVGNAGSGDLDTSADYYYKYSYYNSESGHESNLSGANNSAFTTSTGKISVDVPQNASVDSQVDKIRLYRTEGGGTATGTFKWTGVNFDASGLASGDVTCADTVGDSSLSTTGSWTDRYQPGYGGGTDFKFIEICREICFLAGESTNPSRLYFSSIGYPERYGATDFYDVGKDDGQIITGIREFGGNLAIGKERSIWVLFNAYDPNQVNLVRVSDENGCISDDFLISDGNRLYFMDVDGGKFFDGANFVKYTDLVSGWFDEMGENALPLPVKRNILGIIWNRKLLHFYSSKELNTSSQVVKWTTEYTADTGGENSSADYSADWGETSFESGTDAVIILDHTQSSLNKLIEVTVFIPFDESQFRQTVEFSIYFSYDDGVSWKRQLTDIVKFQMLANYPGDLGGEKYPRRVPRSFKDIAPVRNHTYTFYDVGVTQIRLDLHGSYANGSLTDSKGDSSDSAKLSSIDLLAVGYYYVDTSVTVTYDRVLAYNLDSGKWDAPWLGSDFKPNCVALGDRSSDLYELYFGDAEKGQVYQFGKGDYDDDEQIIGWFQTKHFGARDGVKRFFDRMFLKLLTDVGSFQLVVFVDNVEKLRKTVRSESSSAYHGSAIFRQTAFGGDRSIIDRMLLLQQEGEFLGMQIIRQRDMEMPLLQVEIESKLLEF